MELNRIEYINEEYDLCGGYCLVLIVSFICTGLYQRFPCVSTVHCSHTHTHCIYSEQLF